MHYVYAYQVASDLDDMNRLGRNGWRFVGPYPTGGYLMEHREAVATR